MSRTDPIARLDVETPGSGHPQERSDATCRGRFFTTSPTMLVLASLLLGGCSVQPLHDPTGPVPLMRGSAAYFEPLVPESTASPTCVDPVSAPLPSGGRAVALFYPRSPQRQVTVTVDGSGDPTKYLDVRGDLSDEDGDMGDRTTIGLYLTQGYALLSNRRGQDRPEIVEVPLEEVLTSTALSNPAEEMEHVLTTCSGASSGGGS